jgi:hypothetical protein
MSRKPAVRQRRNLLAWVVPVLAVAAVGGFFAGQRSVGGASAAGSGLAANAAGPVSAASTAEDREDRAANLYDDVMRSSEAHRLDSVMYYAPKAFQAYAALGRLDAHVRYDVGMIWAVVGDSVEARAEADTILAQRPTHLLGLMLAMRTAATPPLRTAFQRRFVKAYKPEMAAALAEYAEHRHDIDGALLAAGAAKK